MEPSWALLGPFRGPLGLSWGPPGPSWALLGPIWGPLESLWTWFGGLLGRVGHCEGRKSGNAKHARFPKGMGQIFRLWALLGGVGMLRWRLLEPSEEHIECLGA
eukprot:1697376-Pyramimonas_sp.AAC.1